MNARDEGNAELHLWELIEGMRFAMLTTRGADGALRSRPLTTQNRSLDPADPALWFFVPRGGEVATDIAADPSVNLAFADLDKDRYVSVAGRAALVDDRERIRSLWSTMAKAWFPGGPDDPNVQLLRVPIEHAEYWDVKSSKLVQLARMATAAVTGTPPRHMGEHREVRQGH